MDYNLAIIAGSLAAPPELREFESGSRFIRYLITTRLDEPRRRTDVVPVTLWDPSDELIAAEPAPGRRLWTAGYVQRRFWPTTEGRRSRIEVVAHAVDIRDPDEDAVATDE